MVKALILAGGFGKRLRPLTLETPKPLLEVGNKPILEWQINWLKRYGIRDIILAVGYLKEKIFAKLGDGSKLGVRLFYSVEEEPLGTGGAIRNARKFLEDDNFIVLNGDILTNIDLNRMFNALDGNSIGAIALVPLPSPYGIVELEGDKVVRFREKPIIRDYLINAGIYYFTPKIFNYLPEKGDIEKTAFPQLAQERKLKGIVFDNIYWRSIDSIKDLEKANKEVIEFLKF